MSPVLHVEADEPGRRLVLGSRSGTLPVAVTVAVVVAVVALAFGFPALRTLIVVVRASEWDAGRLFGVLFELSIPVIVVGSLAGFVLRSRFVKRFALDRDADRLQIVEGLYLGARETSESIPLSDLLRLRIQGAFGGAAPGSGGQPLKLDLTFRDGTDRAPRSLALRIAALDRKEEASDLALRIAAVAGLGYQRLIRSDAREIDVEFGPLGGPGMERRADPKTEADYAQNKVAAAAAALAAREEVPPFDPKSLESPYRVDVWQPGQEVRFRKGTTLGAIGCAPFLLLILAGPAMFYVTRQMPPEDLGARIAVSAFAGLVGLILFAVAFAVVMQALPRSTSLDWIERRLRVRAPFRSQELDFSQVASLELACTRKLHRTKNSSYWLHRAELVAHTRARGTPPAKPISIVTTNAYRDDAGPPYRMAFPLLVDLAAALGVPRSVTDKTV